MSKNRPIQLDLLLRSYKLYFKEWDQVKNSIIYLATNEEFNKGYEIVKSEHPEFNFVEQTHFQTNVLENIDQKQQFTAFLVDDIVFKADFSASDTVFGILKNNNHIISLSLRLHPKINYCYATDKSIKLPNFVRHVKDHYRIWKWPGAEGDWGYGISLDFDFFNTSFILPLLNKLNYNNPNQMESVLNDSRLFQQGFWPIYKCCYDGLSKLINNPVNRVQNEFKNRVENTVSAEELNKMFLEGKRISLQGLSEINNGACHYPFEYKIV